MGESKRQRSDLRAPELPCDYPVENDSISHLRKAACKMISITTKDTHAYTPPFDIQYSLFPSQFPVEEKYENKKKYSNSFRFLLLWSCEEEWMMFSCRNTQSHVVCFDG